MWKGDRKLESKGNYGRTMQKKVESKIVSLNYIISKATVKYTYRAWC